MTRTEFKKYLKKENISFEEKEGKIIITKNNGCLDLDSLTSMPKGIEFNNVGDVYLTSLTSLPEGTKFNNGGDVDLRFLTSLPEGTKFNNGGYVDLRFLTSLPEGTKFNNGGYVYLNSLTSMPEGIEFNNGGDVDLYSLISMFEVTKFNNGGYVNLNSLTSLPEGTKFNNGSYVDLRFLTSLPEGTKFNNGGYVDLDSLTSMPKGIEFNNGGGVYLKGKMTKNNSPYVKRFKVKRKGNKVYLYKRVSHDFKTQEDTENETLWKVGTTVTHPAWNPTKKECGEGKFHACAFPHWCSAFRSEQDDKFIKIEVGVKDLYEWTNFPQYPQKIAFRKGKVLREVKLKF